MTQTTAKKGQVIPAIPAAFCVQLNRIPIKSYLIEVRLTG